MTILLRGGSVVDGSGAEPKRADVRITADVIGSVGDLTQTPGDDVVDIQGHMVMPGFIDAHSHASPALRSGADESQLALLAQGVTTVLLGQDGMGFAPASANSVAYAEAYFGGIDGSAPDQLTGGATVGDLLATWDGAAPLNVAYLVPAGLVRHQVMAGARRAPNRAELRSMIDRVVQGVLDGAIGMSSGLEYVPGGFASTPELIAICRPLAELGVVHASHIRGYERRLPVAGDELIEIASTSGVRTHVAHLTGSIRDIQALKVRAAASGVDLTFDGYPYRYGCTVLAMKTLPTDVQADGPAATIAQLLDSSGRSRIASAWSRAFLDEIERYRLAGSLGAERSADAGLSIGQAARTRGETVREYLLAILVRSRLQVTCVVPGSSSYANVPSMVATYPGYMASSDGIYVGQHPHPRGWGAFARSIRTHVIERRDWSWGQAAWFLAGHAARRFGLHDRGRVAKGAAADVVVLDPADVLDRATYAAPRQLARGVKSVFVNGRQVYGEGQLLDRTAGRSLYRTPDR